jgi:hypothetical protein
MAIAAKVNWCVHIVVDDEVERLGTVQAQTHQEAYVEASKQFDISPERQNRLFVRPINRRVRSKPGRGPSRHNEGVIARVAGVQQVALGMASTTCRRAEVVSVETAEPGLSGGL